MVGCITLTRPYQESKQFELLFLVIVIFSYKKNIKQLIIVHPSWWFRLIIGFMQNIVSSKFAKKVKNINSIEELEDHVNTTDMMIPADVRIYDREENGEEDYDNDELERAQAIMDGGKKPKIFKVSLAEYDGEDYPEEIKSLIEHLTNKGLKSDGIFRRSPNQESLCKVISEIDARQPINFDDYDVNTLASVLKEYVRGLPETLIPASSYPILQSNPNIQTMDESELIPFIQTNFLKPLDMRSLKLLKDLMMLSAMTAQLSNINRMSAKAMAVVWAPNMIKMDSKADEMKIITAVIRVIECMIVNYDQLFCRKY